MISNQSNAGISIKPYHSIDSTEYAAGFDTSRALLSRSAFSIEFIHQLSVGINRVEESQYTSSYIKWIEEREVNIDTDPKFVLLTKYRTRQNCYMTLAALIAAVAADPDILSFASSAITKDPRIMAVLCHMNAHCYKYWRGTSDPVFLCDLLSIDAEVPIYGYKPKHSELRVEPVRSALKKSIDKWVKYIREDTSGFDKVPINVWLHYSFIAQLTDDQYETLVRSISKRYTLRGIDQYIPPLSQSRMQMGSDSGEIWKEVASKTVTKLFAYQKDVYEKVSSLLHNHSLENLHYLYDPLASLGGETLGYGLATYSKELNDYVLGLSPVPFENLTRENSTSQNDQIGSELFDFLEDDFFDTEYTGDNRRFTFGHNNFSEGFLLECFKSSNPIDCDAVYDSVKSFRRCLSMEHWFRLLKECNEKPHLFAPLVPSIMWYDLNWAYQVLCFNMDYYDYLPKDIKEYRALLIQVFSSQEDLKNLKFSNVYDASTSGAIMRYVTHVDYLSRMIKDE